VCDVRDWQKVADALLRLAEDQRGKPEGIAAREKLKEILDKHPEARGYRPIQELVERDISMADVGRLRREGWDQGSWTGRNLDEAIKLMCDDYRRRLMSLYGGGWGGLLDDVKKAAEQ
jgi:hypothetical protein